MSAAFRETSSIAAAAFLVVSCGSGGADYAAGGALLPPIYAGTQPIADAGSPDGGLVDGGTVPDGGRLNCGPNRADLVALDGCATGTQPGVPGQAAVVSSSCDDAVFFVSTTSTTCTGTIAGPTDVFSGTCRISNGNALPCSAANGILPGVITCGPLNCTIRVCIQGQDGGC
jgi:hypothetical protein